MRGYFAHISYQPKNVGFFYKCMSFIFLPDSYTENLKSWMSVRFDYWTSKCLLHQASTSCHGGNPVPFCQLPECFHSSICGIHAWMGLHVSLFHFIGFWVFLTGCSSAALAPSSLGCFYCSDLFCLCRVLFVIQLSFGPCLAPTKVLPYLSLLYHSSFLLNAFVSGIIGL